MLSDFKTIDVRQYDIEQHQVGSLAGKNLERGCAGLSREGRCAKVLHILEQFGKAGTAVFDNEDFHGGGRGRSIEANGNID